MWGPRLLRFVAMAAITLVSAGPLRAQPDRFYAGKTINMIIPIGPGGAYDTYARLVGRHLGKQITGNPTIVPRNMPGAGGGIASSYLFNAAPQDGTTLIVITSTFALDQLLQNSQVKYDGKQFLAIGRLLDTRSILFFSESASIKTAADLRLKPSTIAVSTLNEVPAVRLRLMNRLLGTQMRLIPGYPSARDFVLATERGETDGGETTYIGIQQLFAPALRGGKLKIVLQFGSSRDPDLKDIPALLEMTDDPGISQIFRFLVSGDEIGRTLFTTPNVPSTRVDQLRAAFQSMLSDSAFRADAERLNLSLSPKAGGDMQKVASETFDISASALSRIKELTAK